MATAAAFGPAALPALRGRGLAVAALGAVAVHGAALLASDATAPSVGAGSPASLQTRWIEPPAAAALPAADSPAEAPGARAGSERPRDALAPAAAPPRSAPVKALPSAPVDTSKYTAASELTRPPEWAPWRRSRDVGAPLPRDGAQFVIYLDAAGRVDAAAAVDPGDEEVMPWLAASLAAGRFVPAEVEGVAVAAQVTVRLNRDGHRTVLDLATAGIR